MAKFAALRKVSIHSVMVLTRTQESDTFLNADLPYEFDYLPKDRPYNEERYDKFISKYVQRSHVTGVCVCI